MAGAASPDNKDLQRAVGAAAQDLNRQRVVDRMQQAAEQIRAAAQAANSSMSPSGQDARTQAAKAAASQQAVARDLENLADKLAAAQAPRDDAARQLADQRARVQQLRDEINRLSTEMQKAAADPQPPSGTSTGRSSQKSAGDSGQSGQGQAGSGGTGASLAALRREYAERLREAQQLIDQLRREDPSAAQGGPGLTFEGQGMTLSAPGTEAFKQDFAKWEQLRQQATLLLGRAESSLSQRLQAQLARDRLSAGSGDRPPAAYRQQVDDYFKALADQKK
jgi:hypothetical protein